MLRSRIVPLVCMLAVVTAGILAVPAASDGPTPHAPELKVLSPNGGETWFVGYKYDITWVLTNVSGMMFQTEISYSTSGWNGTFVSIANVNSHQGPNTYTWSVPNTPTIYAVVRVRVAYGTTGLTDMSDGLFEIKVASQGNNSVLVIRPNGGEVLFAGQPFDITWNVSSPNPPPYDVVVRYSTTGPTGPWMVIANVSHNTPLGTYQWTVPNTPSTDAYVLVSELAMPAEDMSDKPFEISSAGGITPTVEVVDPNGGEVLTAGTAYDILWNVTAQMGQGFPTELLYSVAGPSGKYTSIVNTQSNRGMNSYKWSVPNTPTTHARIKVVVNFQQFDIHDVSDADFEIRSSGTIVLDRVEVSPKTAMLQVGGTQQFTAAAYDQNGSDISGMVTFTWSTTGNIGQVDKNGLFTAQSVGSGHVVVKGTYQQTSREDRANVTVVSSGTIVLDRVEVSPKTAMLQVGGTRQFTAAAYDQNGSDISGMVTFTWSTTGNIGQVDKNGLFTAQSVGSGHVVATGTFGGISKSDMANVTVTTSGGERVLTRVDIEPKNVSLKIGDKKQFAAIAYDQDGNIIDAGVSYTWSVTGSMGEIDQTGLFTAKSEGSGEVTVEAVYGNVSMKASTKVDVECCTGGGGGEDIFGPGSTGGLVLIGAVAAAAVAGTLAALWFFRRRGRTMGHPEPAGPPVQPPQTREGA